ncbi:MAG: response regulator [Candidatus Binatia bacterium]
MSEHDDVDILLVDDRPEQRLSLAAVLSELGERVVEAASGKDALREVLRHDFAVILLDVNMPGMDGFETASLIRKRKESEHTPIIFITAYGDDTHASRGYSLGAVDYILSPVDPEVLKTKVSVFVELFRKTLEVKRQAEALRRRTEQLHRLTEVSLAIHSAPSVEKILEVATESAAAIVGAHQAAIRLFAPQDGAAPTGAHWLSEKYGSARSASADQIGLSATLGNGRPLRLTQLELESFPEWRFRKPADGLPMRGWLAAPLAGRDGSAMGSIQLSDKLSGEFTEDDEAIVVQLAQMVSVAVENVLYSEAREANRLKDEFLGTLSHELRTPLQAVLTWVQLLRREDADRQTIGRGLEVIERSARAQTRLIEDILDVSRIVAGKLRVERRPLDLGKIVAAAVEGIRPAAAAKNVEIRTAVPASPCRVSGDPVRLQQVLGNLLSNGVKFTPAGGRIDVRLEEHGTQARIAVSDTGKGIPPEFLPRIFERFRQADSGTTRSHGGLGIGLTIARHLVELHGGRLRADSPGEGRGATFTVILPRLAASSHATALQAAETSAAASAVALANGVRLDGVRVLLVEDENDTRECLTLALAERGADVTAVASTADALSAFEQSAPDILVSDIGMARDDGYALIRELRAREAGKGVRLPAAALTAYVRPEDRTRALLAGFDAHLEKPVGPAELVTLVKHLARRMARG